MFNVNKVEVKVSDETVQRLTDYLKAVWLGAPKWLRFLMCGTLIVGAIYFLYNRLDTASQVDELKLEIKTLNERCSETVFVERYAFDVNNFITVARAIDKEVQVIYEINQQILEFEQEYISRNRPGDPSLVTVRRLIQENYFAKESFDNVVQYNLKLYEDWIQKVRNNEPRSLNKPTENN